MYPNDQPVSDGADEDIDDELESGSETGEEDEESEDNEESGDSSASEDEEVEEDEAEEEDVVPRGRRHNQIDSDGSGSDSGMSDGQADRCAICLSRYLGQEIGSPDNCDHNYCAECILEWSKNMTTCPVDRLPFTAINIRQELDGAIKRKVAVGVRETVDAGAENDEDETFCQVCEQSDREDRMLLCDGCDLGFHLECLNPPLRNVPIEEWFCPTCAADNPDNLAEAVEIDDGELNSLLDDQPAVVEQRRALITRLLPRTRQSERVRRVIQRRRAATNGTAKRRKTKKRKGGTRRKKTKAKQSTSLSSSSKKTKRRRRRRRRKRRVGKKVRVARVTVAKTARERLAEQLGVEKILPNHFLPVLSGSGQSRMGNNDGRTSTLQLFGTRNELIAFDDCSDDEVSAENGEVMSVRTGRSRRLLKSNLARLSHRSLAHQVPSSSASDTNFDLLGSILSSQSQLQLPCQKIRIERDGSLRLSGEKVLTRVKQCPSDPLNGSTSSGSSQRGPPASASTPPLPNDRASSTAVNERFSVVNRDSLLSTGSVRQGESGDGGSSYVDSHCKIGRKKKKTDEEKKKVDDDDIDIYSDIAPGFENEDAEHETEPMNCPAGLEELSLIDGDSRLSTASGTQQEDNAEAEPGNGSGVDSEDDLVIDESVKHEEENVEDEQQLANEESEDTDVEDENEEDVVEQEENGAELVDDKESPDSPVEDAPLQTEDISSDEQDVDQVDEKLETSNGNEEQQSSQHNNSVDGETDLRENDNEEAEDCEEGGNDGEEEYEEEDEEEEEEDEAQVAGDENDDEIGEEEEEEFELEKDTEQINDNDDDIEIIEQVETANNAEDDDEVIVTEVRKVNKSRFKNDHSGGVRRRERRRSAESNSSRHRRHRVSPHHSTSNNSSRRHSKPTSGSSSRGYEEGDAYNSNAQSSSHRSKTSSSSSKYDRRSREGDDHERTLRANASESSWAAAKLRHDSRERMEKLQKDEEKSNAEEHHEGRQGDVEARTNARGGSGGGGDASGDSACEISWKKLSQSTKTRNYRDNRTRLEQHQQRMLERQKRERERQSNTQCTPPPPPTLPHSLPATSSSASSANNHEKEEKRRDKRHSDHRHDRDRNSSSSMRRDSNERRHIDKRKGDKHSHTNSSATTNNSVSGSNSRDLRQSKQHRHNSSSSGGGGRVGGGGSRESGGSHVRERTKDRRDRKEAKKEKIKRELERIEREEKHRERKRERAMAAAASPLIPPPPPPQPSSPPSVSPLNASPPSTIESKEVYASGDKIIINVNFGRTKQSEREKERERSKKRHHQPNDVGDEKSKKKRTKYDHYRPKGIQSPPTPPWNPYAEVQDADDSGKEEDELDQEEIEEEDVLDEGVEDEETRDSESPGAMSVDGEEEEAEMEEEDNSSIQESVEDEEEDVAEAEVGSQAKDDVEDEDEVKMLSKSPNTDEGEEENSVYDPFEPTKSPSDKDAVEIKRSDAPPPLPELPPLPPEPAPEDNSSHPVVLASVAVSSTTTTSTAPISIKLDFHPPLTVQTPTTMNPNFTTPVLTMPPPPSVLPPPPTPITIANIRVPPPNYLQHPPPQLPNFPWPMGAAAAAAAANILFRPSFLSHPPPPIRTGSGTGNATVAAAAATQIRTLLHNQAAQLALLSSLRPTLPSQLNLPPLQQPPFATAQTAAAVTMPPQSNMTAGVNGESVKQQVDTTEVVDMDVDSPYSPGDTLDSAPPTSNNNNSDVSDNKKGAAFDSLLGGSQSRKENMPTRFSHSGSASASGGGGKARPSSGGGKASGGSSSHRSHRTKGDSHRKHIVRFEMTGGNAKGGGQTGVGGAVGAASKKDDGKKEVVAKMDESQLKILDELPSSAVEMQVKEKFLKKLNRQERVIEEVKLAVKPYYNRREINKDEYKEILRKSVPKICHNKSGEINPVKIKALVEGYVKKFKYQHKKDAKVSGGGGKRS